MAKILDGICSNTLILEGIDDWPRSASKKEWFRITRKLIQSVIADIGFDPDSLSQFEEAFISGGVAVMSVLVIQQVVDSCSS